MRKLLLAGVAIFGSVGLASAQTAPAPMPMAPLGNVTAPTAFLGGNNKFNSDGSGGAAAGAPTPGSFVIHINGRVAMYAAVAGGDGMNETVNTTIPASTASAPQLIPWATASSATLWSNPGGVYTGASGHGLVKGDTYNFIHGAGSSAGGLWAVTTPAKSTTATNKLAPQMMLGYFRLYPGVDAMATNGMRYGAIVEIRQNFGTVGGTVPSSGAPNSSGASGQTAGDTLYVRREAVYIGSNSIGIFRFGQDDGPFSQFDNGVTTFQLGTGLWNGDLPPAMPGNTQPTWPFWSGIGNEYTISKAVYLSPSFSGFDLALSYAPNNSNTIDSGCGVAGSGCQNLTTSSTAADGSRAENMFEGMVRYQGNFSGVGIYAIGGYAASGVVNVPAQAYNGFSVGDGGLVLSYAGFSIGGNAIFGDFNGQVGLQPKGGKSAIAYVVGASYATGPITVGASWFNYQSQGSAALIGQTQRYDEGFAASAVYALAPGINAYAEYLWGQVHQGGWDFVNNETNAAAIKAGITNSGSNTASTQAFLIGTKVSW